MQVNMHLSEVEVIAQCKVEFLPMIKRTNANQYKH